MKEKEIEKGDYGLSNLNQTIPNLIISQATVERLGESGATHDSQSVSQSGVEARVARILNGWDDSEAGLSQG